MRLFIALFLFVSVQVQAQLSTCSIAESVQPCYIMVHAIPADQLSSQTFPACQASCLAGLRPVCVTGKMEVLPGSDPRYVNKMVLCAEPEFTKITMPSCSCEH